jgi:hypothetical protein
MVSHRLQLPFLKAKLNNAGTCSEGNVIERSTDGLNFQPLATYPPNQNTGTDGFLHSGTRYYYRVRAQSNGGESGPSNVASAVAPQVLKSRVVN